MPETWTAIGVMAAFGLGALGLLATLHARIDQLGRELRQEMREGFNRLERRLEAHLEDHPAAGGGA